MKGLCTNENYFVFKWLRLGSGIYFSATRRGDACSIHYTHKKKDAGNIQEAVIEFIDYVYWIFPWCKMILACIPSNKENVKDLARSLGFELVAKEDGGDIEVFMRCKDGWIGR